MSKFLLSITYNPKIEAVFSGSCNSTIRKTTKFREGDQILIHTWAGKPYRSKWDRRIKVKVVYVLDMHLKEDIVIVKNGLCYLWADKFIKDLERIDNIDTGDNLKAVLKRLNGKNWEGHYQLILWEQLGTTEGKE